MAIQAAIPYLVAGGASLLGSIIGSQSNANMNSENRQWQSNERRFAQDWQHNENVYQNEWQEQMYNQYNSPSAMMRQYREAGINPFLNTEIGSAMSSNPANVGAPSAPSPVTAPSGNIIQSGIDSAVGRILESKQVDAHVANQQAMTMREYVNAATAAYKIDPKLGVQILNAGFKSYGADQETFSNLSREFNASVANEEAQADKNKAEAILALVYEPKKAQAYVDQCEQGIVESVYRCGLMSKQGEKIESDIQVNQKTLDKIASEIVKNHADAFLAVAKGMTENQLREFVVDLTRNTARKMRHEADITGYTKDEEYAKWLRGRDRRTYMASDEGAKRDEWNYKMSPEGNYVIATTDGLSTAILGAIFRMLK